MLGLEGLHLLPLRLLMAGDVQVDGEDSRQLGQHEGAHGHDEGGAVGIDELGLLDGGPGLVTHLLCDAADVKDDAD